MKDFKDLHVDKDGTIHDEARVEMGLVGGSRSPIMFFRFYMSHQPEDVHLTIWKWHRVSEYVGSWTPPAWLLKLMGQVKP